MKSQFQESTDGHIYAASEVVRVHRSERHEGSGLGGSRGGGIARHRRVHDGAAGQEADSANCRLRVQRLVNCLKVELDGRNRLNFTDVPNRSGR